MTSLNDERAKWQKEIGKRIAASYNAEDAASRRRMFDELQKVGDLMEGPAVGVVELAQMVAARVRGREEKVGPSAEEVASEIESTLNLIEMCQWLLHVRRREWQASVRKVCDIDGGPPTEIAKVQAVVAKALDETRRNVSKKKFPLGFAKGLIAMGNNSEPAEERVKRFARFFLARFSGWNWHAAPIGALRLFSRFHVLKVPQENFVSTETIFGSFVEEIYLEDSSTGASDSSTISVSDICDWIHKVNLWPDPETLLWVAKEWHLWVRSGEEKTFNKIAAGNASVERKREKRENLRDSQQTRATTVGKLKKMP